MSNRASLTPDSGQVKEQLKSQQDRYGHYYNTKAGPTLKPHHPSQLVRILNHHTNTWKQGTVLRAAKEPRSFIVKNNTTDGVYRHTRSHLRPDTTSACAHSPTPVQVFTAVTRPPSPSRIVETPPRADDQPPGDSPEPRPPCKDRAAPREKWRVQDQEDSETTR